MSAGKGPTTKVKFQRSADLWGFGGFHTKILLVWQSLKASIKFSTFGRIESLVTKTDFLGPVDPEVWTAKTTLQSSKFTSNFDRCSKSSWIKYKLKNNWISIIRVSTFIYYLAFHLEICKFPEFSSIENWTFWTLGQRQYHKESTRSWNHLTLSGSSSRSGSWDQHKMEQVQPRFLPLKLELGTDDWALRNKMRWPCFLQFVPD